MGLLKWIESWRVPFWDTVFGAITHLGSEVPFIVVALIVLWCVDKRRGYYLMFCGCYGLVGVQILKMIFRIPRPWVKDPSFTIVESAREAATGYSFPSGHTQTAVTLYGGAAISSRRRWVQLLGWGICALVAFSRMYLGVHTPLDVGVSFALGVCVVFGTRVALTRAERSRGGLWWLIGAAILLAIGNLLFVELYRFPADVDAVNYNDAIKVAWQMLGLMAALGAAYAADRYLTHYETDAPLWGQIVKVALGLGLMLALRAVLKAPMNDLLGLRLGTCIRYFLTVGIPAALLPALFRFLPKKHARPTVKD